MLLVLQLQKLLILSELLLDFINLQFSLTHILKLSEGRSIFNDLTNELDVFGQTFCDGSIILNKYNMSSIANSDNLC